MVFALLCAGTRLLNAEGTKTLIMGDEKANRINMVYIAEGYTKAEQTRFVEDVRLIAEVFFNKEPWSFYKHFCNVYAIGVESEESGCDHPASGISKNTYFEGTFGDGVALSSQYVYIQFTGKLAPLLAEHVPDYDLVCVLINDPFQAGMKYSNYVLVTMSAVAGEMALHEFGHLLVGLADEYDNASGSASESKNVTAKTTRSQIRWNVWIDPSTPVPTPETPEYDSVPGLFEGAMYNPAGWYRPKNNCTMRTTNAAVNFCEICREEIIVTINRAISYIDTFSPSNATTLQNGPGMFLSVNIDNPGSLGLKTEWRVNGRTLSHMSDTLMLADAGLKEGTNIIRVRVSDTTGLVRMANNKKLLVDSVRWSIENGPVNVRNVSIPPVERMQLVLRNHEMYLDYYLSQPRSVRITLHDMAGRVLYTTRSGMEYAGMHDVHLGNYRAGTGIYLVRFSAGDQSVTHTIPVLFR